jgi:hypothetical protein
VGCFWLRAAPSHRVTSTALLAVCPDCQQALPLSQTTKPHSIKHMGRDSSVRIATRYGLDGPGIESRWGRDFQHRSWGPPSLLYNGYRVSFPGVKRPGRNVNHSPLSTVDVNNEWRYTSTPPLHLHGVSREVFTFYLYTFPYPLPCHYCRTCSQLSSCRRHRSTQTVHPQRKPRCTTHHRSQAVTAFKSQLPAE